MSPLFLTSLRYLMRHPWQSILMVLGIALGVAVVVAVDLANASASRAFDLSTEAIAGRATHGLTAGGQGVSETLYSDLRRSGVLAGGMAAAPLVSEYVTAAQLGSQPIQLLGIDPFAEAPFRSYLGGAGGRSDDTRPAPLVADIAVLLTQPGAVLLSTDLAEQIGLEIGQRFSIEVAGREQEVFVAGLLEPGDALARRALQSLILADISTAQELTGRLGHLDRIDLILPEGPTPALSAWLPGSLTLSPVEARSGAVEQMTAAFRVNLTALSLLALVVGLFLIYNTMTFSVVQRRALFGRLRCLGVTRREVFTLVMVEAFLVAVTGSLIGLGFGVLLGQGAVQLVTQTINDLYFVVSVSGLQVEPASLLKGALLGLAATLLTAAPPAWEAASSPPRAALSRSGLESKARVAVNWAAWTGAILLALSVLILSLPTRSLVVSFAGTFAAVLGFAGLSPLVTAGLMRVMMPLLGEIWGALGRMAPRDVISALSRTSIAVAALMVAVSVTIGVSLMVSSFRSTVILWLDQILQGDVYISVAGNAAGSPGPPLDPQAVAMILNWPDAARAEVLRAVMVDSPYGPVELLASSNTNVAQERIYLSTALPPAQMWPRLLEGGVLISEPFANRVAEGSRPIEPGDEIILETPQGPRYFPVLGVYYDYASSQGTVLAARPYYLSLWKDEQVTSAALRLNPGTDADEVAQALQQALPGGQRLQARANAALRQEVLVVFDRTFAITGALQILATLVAFIGVLSALLSLELERQRELGILRAVGLTVRQLWGLIMLETGLMGAVAGLLAMPTGLALAWILVYIINRRSFGWTLQLQLDWLPFAQALLVAVLAALLAGLYPAWRMSRETAAENMRFE